MAIFSRKMRKWAPFVSINLTFAWVLNYFTPAIEKPSVQKMNRSQKVRKWAPFIPINLTFAWVLMGGFESNESNGKRKQQLPME